MDIEKLIFLLSRASEGLDDFEKGTVGSKGFGFIFKDLNSDLTYVTFKRSSKVFGAGSHRDLVDNFRKIKRIRKIKSIDELYTINPDYDLIQAGSVKTLVPTMKFGGIEELFDVWMFVKTEDNKTFPARLYYRQSGLAIGGWYFKVDKSIPIYYMPEEKWKKKIPKEFLKIISCSPFNLSKNEINMFLEALKFALKKIPISDFWCVFNHELRYKLMGIEKGNPFIMGIGRFNRDYEYEKKIGKHLNKKYYDGTGSIFTVKEVSENNIYVIDFEYGPPTSNWYGDAKHIYDIIKEMRVEMVDLLIPSQTMKKIRNIMKLTEYTSDSSFVTFLLKKSLNSKSSN